MDRSQNFADVVWNEETRRSEFRDGTPIGARALNDARRERAAQGLGDACPTTTLMPHKIGTGGVCRICSAHRETTDQARRRALMGGDADSCVVLPLRNFAREPRREYGRAE